MSDRFAEIHGLDPGDPVLGDLSRYPELVHPEDRRTFASLHERLTGGAEPLPELSWRIVLPTGAVRWVRAHTARAPSDGRLVGTLHDLGDVDAGVIGVGMMLGVSRAMEDWTRKAHPVRDLLAAVGGPLGAAAAVIWTPSDAQISRLRCRQWWVADHAKATDFSDAVETVSTKPGEGLVGRVWRSGEVTSLAQLLRSDPLVRHAGIPEWPGQIVIPVASGTSVLALIGLHFHEEPRLTTALGAMLDALGRMLGEFFGHHRNALGDSPLTEREGEILQLAADGSTIAAMAHTLALSESTIKTHLEHVHAKLAVTSRQAAVARGLREGWIV